MPLIEVWARWRDAEDKPQKLFVTSVSSPPDGLRGGHFDGWMKDAIAAAAEIEKRIAQLAE